MKVQTAKMKGNQGAKGPKSQNERNWPPGGGGGRGCEQKTFGFRVLPFDRQCGGVMLRWHCMAATAQLYLGLYVRAFWPLAKLGPLRALTASVRALSETLGFDNTGCRPRKFPTVKEYTEEQTFIV